MPDTQDPVRKQLAEARRQQILDAAATVFAEKGFDRATTKEVASAAGVSEGTIYNYFANKDDLLIGILSRLGEAMQPERMLEAGLPGDPHEFLAALFRFRLRFTGQNMAMLQAIFSKILVDQDLGSRYYQQVVTPSLAPIEEHVQARIDQSQFRQVDPHLFAHFLMAINVGLLVGALVGVPMLEGDPERLVEALADLIYRGIRAEDAPPEEKAG